MTCRELIEFLDRYRDGELAAEERTEFEAHLARCPYCVDYLESYERTVRLGQTRFRDPDAALPEGVPEELMAAIRAARDPGSED